MSFAKAVMSGTVASEPEKRFTPNNHAVTNFSMAVENPGNRQGDMEPAMVKVTCWRGLADSAAEQLHKGDEVLVEGKLIMSTLQTPEGAQKKLFEIEATSMNKLAGKPQPVLVAAGSGSSTAGTGYTATSSVAANQPSGMGHPQEGSFTSEDLLTDDDIPF